MREPSRIRTDRIASEGGRLANKRRCRYRAMRPLPRKLGKARMALANARWTRVAVIVSHSARAVSRAGALAARWHSNRDGPGYATVLPGRAPAAVPCPGREQPRPQKTRRCIDP